MAFPRESSVARSCAAKLRGVARSCAEFRGVAVCGCGIFVPRSFASLCCFAFPKHKHAFVVASAVFGPRKARPFCSGQHPPVLVRLWVELGDGLVFSRFGGCASRAFWGGVFVFWGVFVRAVRLFISHVARNLLSFSCFYVMELSTTGDLWRKLSKFLVKLSKASAMAECFSKTFCRRLPPWFLFLMLLRYYAQYRHARKPPFLLRRRDLRHVI